MLMVSYTYAHLLYHLQGILVVHYGFSEAAFLHSVKDWYIATDDFSHIQRCQDYSGCS